MNTQKSDTSQKILKKIKNLLKKTKRDQENTKACFENNVFSKVRSKVLIAFTKESRDIERPSQLHESDAGFDLKAIEDCVVKPGSTILVKTGIKMAIPKGFFGMVCSRSGMALKNGVFVANAPGIVDSSYRGDVGVILYNSSKESFYIKNGDRVAQLVIVQQVDCYLLQRGDLGETERGSGGFGSSGR
jgi:dUTP pyrophosphatase